MRAVSVDPTDTCLGVGVLARPAGQAPQDSPSPCAGKSGQPVGGQGRWVQPRESCVKPCPYWTCGQTPKPHRLLETFPRHAGVEAWGRAPFALNPRPPRTQGGQRSPLPPFSPLRATQVF